MTSFDPFKQASETEHRCKEVEMRILARRDRRLGEWAGDKLGLRGEALQAYVVEVARAHLSTNADEDLVRKLSDDFARHKVEVSPHELRAKMAELWTAARDAIDEEG